MASRQLDNMVRLHETKVKGLTRRLTKAETTVADLTKEVQELQERNRYTSVKHSLSCIDLIFGQQTTQHNAGEGCPHAGYDRRISKVRELHPLLDWLFTDLIPTHMISIKEVPSTPAPSTSAPTTVTVSESGRFQSPIPVGETTISSFHTYVDAKAPAAPAAPVPPEGLQCIPILSSLFIVHDLITDSSSCSTSSTCPTSSSCR